MIITKLGGGSASFKVIAQAIGEPATDKDKKERLAEIINNAKSDIASLCNERGCNIPTKPTFPQIIDGISSLTHFTKPPQITDLRSLGAHDTANIIDLYWSNPTNDKNFQGVNIRYKTGSYPVSETDGTSAYDGTGTSISLSGMTNGTTYYFRAFAYSIVDNVRVFNNLTSGAQCTGVSILNTPNQITNLRAVGNHDTANMIDLSWNNPSDSKYKGVKILYKTGSYPSSPTDGTVAYNSTGASVSLSGMTNGTTYYFRAFAYNLSNGVYAYNTNSPMIQCTGVSTLNMPNQITGLKATVGSLTSGYVKLTWSNPSDSKYKGVRILYKTGGYPTSVTDGTVFYTGTGTSVEKTGLANGTTYYFRAFAYNLSNNIYAYNTGMAGAQCVAVPYINKGQQVFTTSQTWTVPAGVNKIDVFLVGGGSGGSGGTFTAYTNETCYGGGGGSSGYVNTIKGLSVSQGQTFSVVIGAGGSGGIMADYPNRGNAGGTTIFGNYKANGGSIVAESSRKNSWKSHSGGTGGGEGGRLDSAVALNRAGAGGTNGSNGYTARYETSATSASVLIAENAGYGKGAKTITRAFGESSNTLYAGGGGGGQSNANASQVGGAGGGGNGGDFYHYSGTARPATNGTANTGSGGGGGAYVAKTATSASDAAKRAGNGGSGIVIVRWGY